MFQQSRLLKSHGKRDHTQLEPRRRRYFNSTTGCSVNLFVALHLPFIQPEPERPCLNTGSYDPFDHSCLSDDIRTKTNTRGDFTFPTHCSGVFSSSSATRVHPIPAYRLLRSPATPKRHPPRVLPRLQFSFGRSFGRPSRRTCMISGIHTRMIVLVGKDSTDGLVMSRVSHFSVQFIFTCLTSCTDLYALYPEVEKLIITPLPRRPELRRNIDVEMSSHISARTNPRYEQNEQWKSAFLAPPAPIQLALQFTVLLPTASIDVSIPPIMHLNFDRKSTLLGYHFTEAQVYERRRFALESCCLIERDCVDCGLWCSGGPSLAYPSPQ